MTDYALMGVIRVTPGHMTPCLIFPNHNIKIGKARHFKYRLLTDRDE